jgi:hypothetical protein
MISRLEEIEDLLKNANVDPDAYALWKDHPVTKRFMLGLELELLSEREDLNLGGNTCELIAIAAVKRMAKCDALEAALTWKPKELEIED